MKLPEKSDILIIGGGIIGLSLGWQLLRQGIGVTIVDKSKAGKSASWFAAGMLAPSAEVGFEEVNFLKLGVKSLELYPMFLEELRQDSGVEVAFDQCGTLMVGLNRDDSAYLKRLHEFRKSQYLSAEWISSSAARELEPLLSPKVIGAMWLPSDAQIDNRQLISALIIAFKNRGGILIEDVKIDHIDPVKLSLSSEYGVLNADKIVIAAGSNSGEFTGSQQNGISLIRPVKGQIITLKMLPSLKVSRVIRSPRVYLAPKHDGRIVVGATTEEKGFDESITAGAVYELLSEAYEAIPSIYEYELNEIRAGLRPSTRDNEPLLGESTMKDVFYATGHYRHGILLAPVTAYEMVRCILGLPTSSILEPFQAQRFKNLSTVSS